jgi:hypothetical protein
MSALELKVYEIFKTKLGEAEASTILEYIEEKAEKKISEKKDIFLTKEDKVDMIKWMFIFWLGAVGTLSGIMFGMLNAYLKK